MGLGKSPSLAALYTVQSRVYTLQSRVYDVQSRAYTVHSRAYDVPQTVQCMVNMVLWPFYSINIVNFNVYSVHIATCTVCRVYRVQHCLLRFRGRKRAGIPSVFCINRRQKRYLILSSVKRICFLSKLTMYTLEMKILTIT